MSARGPASPAPGFVERLVRTPLFNVLFGVSAAFAGLLLLAGLACLPILILIPFWITAGSGVQPEALTASFVPAGLVAGGILGVVGLIRGHRRSGAARSGSIELTIVFLAGGIAAALVPIADIVVFAFGAHRAFDRVRVVTACLVGVPLAVLIVAAIGSIQRLTREYAAHAGEPFDVLPVIFLLMSLGLAIGAAVLGGAA
jgi:hypothetical protein